MTIVGDVTVIVLTYEGPYEVLEAAVRGAVDARCGPVVVADNGTRSRTDDLDRVERELPQARYLRFGANHGFAGGVNRALAHATTPYVLLLNNDAVLEPGAVDAMRAEIDVDVRIAGVAPKIVFADAPSVLDGVGTLVNERGDSWNRGIGQPDLGQYDTPERVFGACFAAALLRRELFGAAVGPLEERYFMYYEDVDWCFRANARGYSFRTAPAARVLHRHSFTTRSQGQEFRYRYIERNLIWTLVRNADHPFGIVGERLASHASCVLRRRPFPRASARVIAETATAMPVLLDARARNRRARTTPDASFVALSRGEAPFFDAETFEPTAGARDAALRKLAERSARPGSPPV